MPPLVLAAVLLLAFSAALLVAPAGASEFETTLLRLAERALAEGDLRTAGERYQRVLDQNPGSMSARVGLGLVAQRRGDSEAASAHFEAALALDAGLVAAQLGLAEIAMAAGDRDGALARLEAALALAPLDPRLHQRLFEWTGLATGEVAPADAEAAEALARAHPYDPRVQVAKARFALAAGDSAAAEAALRTALLVADLAVEAAPEATRLLSELRSDTLRFVPVHLFVDETVRAEPGWPFELRIAWARASAMLAPLLHTIFVPVSFGEFSSRDLPADLPTLHRAMLAANARPPLSGILAGFTRRESPRGPLSNRLGQAEFLGREMMVRLDPDDAEGRTLAHEVIHLYGGVHVSPEIPSLMNPTTGERALDRFNARIVEQVGPRRFGLGGLEANVLAHVDEPALADALVDAISVNVHFRNAGVRGGLSADTPSPYVAGEHVRRATKQDRHLAQVAFFTAQILVRVERPAEGVVLMEHAALLFGRRTADGRNAERIAREWRAHFKSFLGDG